MFGSKKRTIARLARELNLVTGDLEICRQMAETYRQALALACDSRSSDALPFNVEEFHEERVIDSFPDGEVVMPEAFDWEKLAQAIIENEQGGASGAW